MRQPARECLQLVRIGHLYFDSYEISKGREKQAHAYFVIAERRQDHGAHCIGQERRAIGRAGSGIKTTLNTATVLLAEVSKREPLGRNGIERNEII